MSKISVLSHRAHRWMFDVALPFWAEHGLDRADGGYVELFDALRRPSAPYKRTRVIGRQIYVFSHAAVLGWSEGFAAAEHGYRFLVQHARLAGGAWARRLDRAGDVIDPAQDLYDIAFVLFALAWYARATGEPQPLRLAHETLDGLDARLRHPAGGFAHELPMTGWRQQNPHMHLLEAALAWIETAPGEGRFRELADELVRLFSNRFYDPASRTLAEYYDDNWARAPGDAGRLTEPGHQFEWAWILANHQRLTGCDNRQIALGLIDFAETHGVDPASQVTFNTVRDDGTPLDRGSRTWPNTERIKAAIARFELTGQDPTLAVASSIDLLFDRYLDGRGTWTEQFDATARPVASTVPASTLYHLFLAFSEVMLVAA
jgi:N-acylglucosamine 2-epimerase/mannose-6-phosphate isomerase